VPWLRQRKIDDVELNCAMRGPSCTDVHDHPTDEEVGTRFPIGSYQVTVLLSQRRVEAHPTDGYEPLSGHVKAIEFTVEATSPLAACEIAYGVTNSSPDDMHCELKYREIVKTYREIGHFRSVAVDDLLEIDGVRYACARFGFTLVPA
jgi:hypothetical protein